jgi:ATP-dependent Clp protease ATP-binding subunit ClpA
MRLINAVRDVRTISLLLTQAEAEARRAGEERPCPEHLVLAAAALPDGTAVRALDRIGTDVQQLRHAIESAHEVALATVGIELEHRDHVSPELRAPARGILRSTPQAQEVFRDAVALSKSTKPSLIRGAHVVAAACQLERGTFVRALAALGIDREALRVACAEAATR